ncbi:hypothetical protein W97_05008 [Coniosporium apollinis CBS 100218]|uniref:Heterokaryon incompatibility domain-containing protein n=1 Tax=Coniosporium apollinis (strain CBS 100218) TaxID=1168221 RepID=R7YVD3_CONA1|nr:uncharacterized protein W97_05008 [Coniosporium apollinis CBS 100218]EON65769.1 hypothetical protein W97_05008 [Coniosporium apollinis CBS 100218]
MAYKYRALDPSKREIRVLSFPPAELEDPEARCDIVHLSLDDRPRYHALSYVWGELEPTRSLFVDGCRVDVRPNLFTALHHLRDAIPGEYLWVDALCINQMDKDERSSQIKIMGDIYRGAEKTLVWLGEEGDGSHLAMDLLSSVTSAGLQDLFENPSRNASLEQSWVALQILFRRPYWSRVWVLQEILLSHPTKIFCGNCTCEWENVQMLLDPDNFKKFNLCSHSARKALLSRTTLPKLLVEIIHRRQRGEQSRLLNYLILSRQRSATEPHDHVYGVLGLVDQEILTADYNEAVEAVYKNVVKRLINLDGNLDVLSACCETSPTAEQEHAPHGPSDLVTSSRPGQESGNYAHAARPSWVPQWCVRFEEDYQAFPLCSGPCKASGDEKPQIQYLQSDQVMQVRGIAIDSIAFVSPDLQTTRWPQVSEDWSAWSGYIHPTNPYGDVEEQREAFLSTLHLGLYDKNNPRKGDGSELFFDKAVRRTGNGVTEEDTGGRTFGTAGRRFFGTRTGYMGRGLHDVRVGDLVVVLLGGKAPFVLREGGMKNELLLVGECYVHGIMNGEAMQGVRDGARVLQDFCLV